ncbi:hypothetical protein EOD10_11780 [Mesorhizobium sp. M7A.T.Ca.TU.009.01.3.2]|nr:hypothetical protein EOD10_11780 [Mesorhizobium sp. M7A.T.Ca.TU.009.01.3.2]
MANGSDDSMRTYSDAVQAALGERVTNMGRRINDVEVEMRAGFSQLSNSLSASTNETRQSIAALSTSLADRAKPQWQALSVIMGFAVVLGGLAYWPIREATSDLKVAVMSLAANTVSRQEMDWRTERGAEDRKRTEETIRSIRDTMVYRNEWSERNLSRDHDIENIRADAVRDIANLQRQLDQQEARYQAFSNSLGNGRDFIIDLKTEQGRLRDQIASLTAKVAAEAAAAAPR